MREKERERERVCVCVRACVCMGESECVCKSDSVSESVRCVRGECERGVDRLFFFPSSFVFFWTSSSCTEYYVLVFFSVY